jgi:isopenicillin-N epimerase
VNQWLLDPDVAYLNHGAFGALPRAVADAALELRLTIEADPASLIMRRLPAMLNDVRERLAEFLNADAAGCVFVANATTGTATVLAALAASFEPGDEILITDHRYGAVSAQTARADAERGTRTVTAHVPLDVRSVDEVVAAISERITPRTRLLVVDAIASPTGFAFPVQQIVAAAHGAGVPVLVDAAHAPGQVANDLTAIGADFWVGNLHKWICSPRAAAILSVAPRWRDVVKPFVASHHFGAGLQPAFDWTGTYDPVNILAVPAALDFWDIIGWDEVRRQQRALVDHGAPVVAAALGTGVPVSDDFRAAMRIVELPEKLTPQRAGEIETQLSDKHQIEVSLMHIHDKSFVRVCGQIYNTPEDYQRLAAALPEVIG